MHMIKFCMRSDKNKTVWKAMRSLLASGQEQAVTTLKKPNAQDVRCDIFEMLSQSLDVSA